MLDTNRILFCPFKNGLHDGQRALSIGNGITTLQIKGPKPKEKAVTLVVRNQACHKSTPWQKITHMNFMVRKSQWRECLLLQRSKALLVSIELSVEVQDTKLKLVESYLSINICEKLGVAYAQNFAEFWSSHVEWY